MGYVPTVKGVCGHAHACPQPRTGFVWCDYRQAWLLEKPSQEIVMRKLRRPRRTLVVRDNGQAALWHESEITQQNTRAG